MREFLFLVPCLFLAFFTGELYFSSKSILFIICFSSHFFEKSASALRVPDQRAFLVQEDSLVKRLSRLLAKQNNNVPQRSFLGTFFLLSCISIGLNFY